MICTGTINVVLGVQTNAMLFPVLWGLNGFCQSMFWSTLLRLLSCYAQEHQRKTVSTLMSISSVTGYLFSWVVLSWLFKPYGHTPYFAVPGGIALALIPLWVLLARKVPFSPTEGGRQPTPPLPVVAGEFLHDRLYFICLLCMVVGAIQEGAVFWLPLVFTDVLQLGEGSLLLLAMIPFAKLAGVFLARAILARLQENVRKAILITLSMSCALSVILLVTCRHTSFLTVVLIACLIATINASNWYMISYLPLHFASRNIVATLGGAFDFSTYMGAAVMSGPLGDALLTYGWITLPIVWLVLTVISLALALGGAGTCLARRGARRE
jgi:OPA family glycerol-3-phosphate transporter-like MFS transporter